MIEGSNRSRRVLLAVLVVGGLAVLSSYVYGYLAHPESRWDIWGGVPLSLRPLYTVSMFAAALGFFPFTLFFLLEVKPTDVRLPGATGYGVIVALYALALIASAAWMPLTFQMIEAPSQPVWYAIRVVLGLVALAAIGLLVALLKLRERKPVSWYRAAVVGCVLFCWQTVVLDAVLWPLYYPL
ncbi:MAG: hypothetical protein GX600_08420 [Dehalococcoidia bacterium]|nr:hypothetical protein [Dehalococcoidia bacterium]